MRKMRGYSLSRGFLGLLLGAMASGAVAQDLKPLEEFVNGGKVTPEEVIACYHLSQEAPLDFRLKYTLGSCQQLDALQCGFPYNMLEEDPQCFEDFSQAFRAEIEQQLETFHPIDARVSALLAEDRARFYDSQIIADCVVERNISEWECAFETYAPLLSSIYTRKFSDAVLARAEKGEGVEHVTPTQSVVQCLTFAEKLPANYRAWSVEDCAEKGMKACEQDAEPKACFEQLTRDCERKRRGF